MKTKHGKGFRSRYDSPERKRNARKRTFLCIEHGGSNLPDEQFTIEAKDMEDARETAAIWNASVIREL